jgi:DNA-binding transcriptional regulator YdaS (Cro superfamily)
MKVSKAERDEIIDVACEKAGGVRALGRAIGINYQNIQSWKTIPAHWIVPIEEATGIPREKLRPELYRSNRR